MPIKTAYHRTHSPPHLPGMKWYHSIRFRMLIASLCITVLPVLSVSVLATWLSYRHGTNEIFSRLNSIADLKVGIIDMWLNNLQRDMKATLLADTENHLKHVLTEHSFSDIKDFSSQYLRKAALFSPRIKEYFLIDQNGYVVASTDSALMGQYRGHQRYFKDSLRSTGAGMFVQALALSSTQEGADTILVTHPIYANDKIIGVLVGRVLAERLTAIMADTAGLGKTGETLLVNNNRILLTFSRYAGYTAGQTYIATESVARALTTQSAGLLIGADYRGVKSVIAYRYIPRLGAALTAKQDYAEATALVHNNIKLSILATVLASLIAALVGTLYSKHISDRLTRLAAAARELALGHFYAQSEPGDPDELGQLARTFNRMSQQLGNMFTQIGRAKSYADEIIANANVMIIITDQQDRIVLFNQAATETTGYSSQTVLRKPIDMLFGQRKPSAHLESSAAKDLQNQSIENAIITAHGEQRYISWRVSHVRDSEGNMQRVYFGSDVTARRIATKQLEFLAHFDSLTQLPNRAYLKNHLAELIDKAKATHRSFALIFIDLDRFKTINDTLGHGAGDHVLIHVAHRLREAVRDDDIVGRISGDEFLVILDGVSTEAEIDLITNKIQHALNPPLQLNGHEITLSASMGVSLYPRDANDSAALLRMADTAMYQGKKQGRGLIQYYTSSMNTGLLSRLKLETELRHALEKQEFVLYFQPQISIQTWNPIGAEALIRWRHPQRGLLLPDQFISTAEETGMIVPIGEWVLRTACEQLRAWSQLKLPLLPLAINLSAVQFKRNDLPDTIAGAIRDTGIDPHLLELEITESMIMDNVSNTITTLRAIKTMGVRVSVDDFGTGYSSFNYLKRFPVNKLKIDQSFVRDMCSNADDAAIAKAITALGHNLGMRVVAEGVEDCAELERLRDYGCDEVQGNLFSPAVPADIYITALQKYLPIQQHSSPLPL